MYTDTCDAHDNAYPCVYLYSLSREVSGVESWPTTRSKATRPSLRHRVWLTCSISTVMAFFLQSLETIENNQDVRAS